MAVVAVGVLRRVLVLGGAGARGIEGMREREREAVRLGMDVANLEGDFAGEAHAVEPVLLRPDARASIGSRRSP